MADISSILARVKRSIAAKVTNFSDSTVTAPGTTGARTINKRAGTVNFAGTFGSLIVTNSFAKEDSIILCTVYTNDTTAYIKNVVRADGSFTIRLGAAATAETVVGFVILN